MSAAPESPTSISAATSQAGRSTRSSPPTVSIRTVTASVDLVRRRIGERSGLPADEHPGAAGRRLVGQRQRRRGRRRPPRGWRGRRRGRRRPRCRRVRDRRRCATRISSIPRITWALVTTSSSVEREAASRREPSAGDALDTDGRGEHAGEHGVGRGRGRRESPRARSGCDVVVDARVVAAGRGDSARTTSSAATNRRGARRFRRRTVIPPAGGRG